MGVQTCAHPACSCQVQNGRYCGDHCRDLEGKDVAKHSTCDCGHDQCRRKA